MNILKAVARGLAVAAVFACSTSNASIIGVTGNISLISPPADVRTNIGLENSSMGFVFAEQQNALLAIGAPVDVTSSGFYSTPASVTPGTIAIGTAVDSYYFHADSVGSDASDILITDGAITFNTDILGIALMDPALAATNFLGAPGTLYGVGGFELGNPDTVTLSADRRTITIHSLTNLGSDDLRIITAAPEPATLALLGLGLASLGFSRRKL